MDTVNVEQDSGNVKIYPHTFLTPASKRYNHHEDQHTEKKQYTCHENELKELQLAMKWKGHITK